MIDYTAISYFYHTRLGELGVKEIKRGTRLQHAMWMCHELTSFSDREKKSRWIGFIQGYLVCEGVYTIDECRKHVVNFTFSD